MNQKTEKKYSSQNELGSNKVQITIVYITATDPDLNRIEKTFNGTFPG